MWVYWITAFAQTGLPLNFSTLPNPLPSPQLYYLDSDSNIPLGDKAPLILIHGIDPSGGSQSVSANGWDNFCIWFYTSPSIRNRFKIYRFVYKSNQVSVQTLGNYLAQLLNANDGSATDQKLAGKDIVILAHSMGGLVARRFMEEQRQTKAAKWNQSALRLITLATPHHGTPGANESLLVWTPLPHFVGALGTKLTAEFATVAADFSNFGGIWANIPAYNQVNRSDLLWDNYDGLFQTGFDVGEQTPSTADLNSIVSAQSYDNKLIAYAGNIADGNFIHPGHDADYLSATADLLANGLGIPSDGIVPIDSAWFQGRIGNSQLKFFDDYDHRQMMQSKTPLGTVPSLSDPLFTKIGDDLTSALPVVMLPTISSVSPRTLNTLPLPQTRLITIAGTGFTSSSRLTFNDGVNPPDTDRVPASWTSTQLTFNIAVGPNPATWTVKVVNGSVESLPYTFYVVSGGAQLTGLSISGPPTVNESANGQFTATAYFSDGSSLTVTASASWSEDSSATTISSSGLLSAGSVGSDTPVTVSASYSAGGITKTGSASVTIVYTGGGGTQAQELIVNGGFESGSTSWTLSGFAGTGIGALGQARSGTYWLWLGGAAHENDAAYQTIKIPANAIAATLSYYYDINSEEVATTAYDTFTNTIRNTSDNVLATVTNLSNKNQTAPGGCCYFPVNFNLLPFAGQTIRIHFGSVSDGAKATNFRIDDVSVQAVVPLPVTLTSLVIAGPSSVIEGNTAQYVAVAVFSDGSTNMVTPNTWSENSSATTISSSGLLTAGQVSADTLVSVYASYTFNGATRDVYKDVTVVNQAATYSYLAISGPSSINENSSGQFAATAIFSDGSSQSVSPSWSENSTATSISSSGLLTTGEIGSDTTVTVSASHTIGGVTRNANQDVLIVNIPPPVTLSSISISGPSSLNENSTAQFTATASFSDGSSQDVNPAWSEDSSATSISIFGLLSAGEVASDTLVTISASYSFNGGTQYASKSVTVNAVPGGPLAQFSQQGPKLVGTGAVGNSHQGYSVSLSADGNTALVGGSGDNGGAGAAWVWTRSGEVWSLQGTKLVGSDAVGKAQQGTSVSLSADGNTALVGGNNDNGGAGAVWVWTRNGGVWTQLGTKLVGSDAVGSALQGCSVSISGDGNTAIIGGFADNSSAGAAWVWTSSGGAWTQQGTKLVGSGAVGIAQQGVSVSLSADGNMAIVGGNRDTGTSGQYTGATWVWTRSGGVWTQQGTKLVGSGAVSAASQGWSVSLSADGNTAIVGGPGDNCGGGYCTGAAWAWTRSGGVWTQQGAKLVGLDAVGGASQGRSVSLSADGNTAIIGGYEDNSSAGAAWVWSRSGGVWTLRGPKLVGSGAVGSARQGQSASLSADGNTAIIGGNFDNTYVGAAWVFATSTPVVPVITAQPTNQAVPAGANATFTVAASGTPTPSLQWQVSTNGGATFRNLTTDPPYSGVTSASLTITAATTSLHGARYCAIATNSAGAATSAVATLTVTVIAGGSFSQQGPKLVAADAVGGAQQGISVSLSADGSMALVGGRTDNGGVGAAWVWTRSGQFWTPGMKLVGSGAVGSAEQGVSVSLSADGNTAIIGGWMDNSGAGAAWVWTRSGGVWTQQGTKLVGMGAVGIPLQGRSVSLSADGNTALVGGFGDNSSAGAAWVWARGGGVWTQQGTKLVGTGTVGIATQGRSVSLSADGNTALVGGDRDSSFAGAAWVWARTGGVWTQETKLVGSGASADAQQGGSVSLSADGNTALIGGFADNSGAGAVWVWTRSGGVWTQQGTKLVGSNAVGSANQGHSVSLSTDGNTALVGGLNDNNSDGAAWVWRRSGGVWLPQGTKLVGSGAPSPSAGQGSSVALSGDGNTALVGGYFDNLGVGAAWVFSALLVGPTVTALSTGNNLTLRWPDSAMGYRVESALSLSPSLTWSNVAGTFQTNDGSIRMVLPMTGPQRFYRLVNP